MRIQSFTYFLLAVVFLLISGQVFAQNESSDQSRIEYFRALMDKLQEAQKTNNDTALISTYIELSAFYNFSDVHEKAKYYKKKQLKLLRNQKVVDSAAIYLALNDYEGIVFSNGEEIDKEIVYDVIDFSNRENNNELKEEALALYHSFLIQRSNFENLKEFYSSIYPEEMIFLKNNNRLSYLRIKALIFEFDHQIDSALHYFELSSKEIENNPNHYLIAKFYIRYGQFWERNNDIQKAIAKYKISLSHSEITEFIPFTLEAAERLEMLYSSQGNYLEAYNYSKRSIDLKDELNSMSNRDELLRLEIQKENELRDIELEKKELSNQAILGKQKNRTLISIAVGVVMLILAIGLWSRVNYTRRVNGMLKKEKLRAEQSERFKQQFLANMSHEIRTPMNAVLGMSNLMLDTKLNEKQKTYLDAIKTSSENLLVIINDVLDLSKLEAGKMVLEKISFKIQEQIQLVYDTLKFKAEEKGLIFEVKIDKEVPETVVGDPSRLNQVLINLCGNAIKFTEKGTIDLWVEPGMEDHLIFRIKDSGIGMSKDEVLQLFTSFQQADASTSRKYGGTGLGLSISKTLVELQGGSIEVKSTKGQGSEFIVNIPFEKILDKNVEIKGGDGAYDKSKLNGIKILVVEDNHFNQIVVNDTLEKLIDDLSVDIAENGKIAIEKNESNEYDVILMDVNMPEMDGLDATRHIRKNGTGKKKDIPIIALTASVLKSEVQNCIDSGMDDFIPKPFSDKELVTALMKYFKRA